MLKVFLVVLVELLSIIRIVFYYLLIVFISEQCSAWKHIWYWTRPLRCNDLDVFLENHACGCFDSCEKIRKKYWWKKFWPISSRFLRKWILSFTHPIKYTSKENFLIFKIFKIWKRQWNPLIKTINLSYWWARFDKK